MTEKAQPQDKYREQEGKLLDQRYYLEKLIGVGGMAVVYRAKDQYTNNTVAIKILKPDVACDEIMVKRFRNESEAEFMIRHKNIVSVLEISLKGKVKYIVMEYVDGMTLKHYLKMKKGPLTFKEIMSYTTQTLRALKAAHDLKIIHRDIKPQNIMLLSTGQIKVMDFGIAKLPNAETLTMTNKALGTVYYMSPEQACGKEIDFRSDIYSLGAVLYELSTGEMPFNGDSPVAILMKQMNNEPIPPRSINSKIPVGLEQIILCAMSKKPSDRFQNAEIMLEYMKQLEANPKIKFDKLPHQTRFVGFFKKIFSKNRKK